MIIGVPEEIKAEENRVGVKPSGAKQLSDNGHKVLVEEGAGKGAGFSDSEYKEVGAEIASREKIFDSDMIIKVKEPLEEEYSLLDKGQIIFTYFHFAAMENLTRKMLEKEIVGIAYETVEEDGSLPLLRPMSEVAGSMAPLVGSFFLQKFKGGKGNLLTKIPGVKEGKVLVLGGGTVGTHAARVAKNMGAEVKVLEINEDRMREIEDNYDIETLKSNEYNLVRELKDTDLVVGAVLIPGAEAPKLIRREHLKKMEPGSVIVDVAVDQGGCIETTHPTTHHDPVYEVGGIVHYAVANMPGAYARTATRALTNATIDYALEIANKGWKKACKENKAIRKGLNLCRGKLTNKNVAKAFDMEHSDFKSLNI